LAERRARRDKSRVTIVVKQWQEVIMLAAEEVLPEKIAGAEEPGQERKRFLVAQKSQGFLPGLALRLLNGEIEKLIEGFQGLGRVRSPSECVRELLDEDSGQP